MRTDEWAVTLDLPCILATLCQHAGEYGRLPSHDLEYSSVFYILVSSLVVHAPHVPRPPPEWAVDLPGVWPLLWVWPPLWGAVWWAVVMVVWVVGDQR